MATFKTLWSNYPDPSVMKKNVLINRKLHKILLAITVQLILASALFDQVSSSGMPQVNNVGHIAVLNIYCSPKILLNG